MRYLIGFLLLATAISGAPAQYTMQASPDVQKITVYSVAIQSGVKQPEAATALIKALTGAEAAAVIKQHGMEPG